MCASPSRARQEDMWWKGSELIKRLVVVVVTFILLPVLLLSIQLEQRDLYVLF